LKPDDVVRVVSETAVPGGKMKRKSLDGALCPIARALDQIGEWWSLLIIRDVAMGKRRFGELANSLGAARNILSTRLKRLVACGILELRPTDGSDRYREYDLTEKGRDLATILLALEQWGSRWATPDPIATPVDVECATGEEIAAIEIQTRDGRRLSPKDPG
jgi:DNA-binding HxlR family transcriptional regulator